MKRVGLLLLIIGLVGIPAQGQEVERSCSPEGYTVVFVNGVFTDEDEAGFDRAYLQEKYNTEGGDYMGNVSFILAHNPTHANIGGLGLTDLGAAALQSLSKPTFISDKYEILWDIHSKLKTRKVLLVGHSQGTYYTNELYDYLTENGIPEYAIRVYNVAAMSDNVRGESAPYENKYLTSSNDSVVEAVRAATETAQFTGAQVPLPHNTTIPLDPDDLDALAPGHAFSEDYLDGASVQIIREIDGQLARLEAEVGSRGGNGCFTPPERTLAYHIEDSTLATFDFGASWVNASGKVFVDTGEVIGNGAKWAWGHISDGASKIAQTTSAWWFSEGALEDNLEAATFALLTPENPENSDDEQSQEAEEENAPDNENEGAVLGEETLPEPAQEEATESNLAAEEDAGENEGQQSQNAPENEPENTENETNQGIPVENQEESESTGSDEGVDNSGTAGENTIENQPESTENTESVNNAEENVENQEESDEPPVDPRWGIRTGGTGRSALPNPDAVRVFGTTMDQLTEEEKEQGTMLVQGTVIGSGNTLLVVWIKRVPADVTFENGTTNTYYDDLLLGRRIRADGSWIDAEPLTLWDPIKAQQLNNITGVMHNGEFVVLLNMTDRANVYARTKIISVPEGHDGSAYSINMIRVPALGAADSLEAQEIQGETWYRYHDRTPHLLNVAPLGDDLLVVFQTFNVLNAGLLIPDADEPFVSAQIMTTGGARASKQIRGAEAICVGDYCVIYWTRHIEMQAGLLDASGDVAGWDYRGCHRDCPLEVAGIHRHFNVSNSQLLPGLGEGSDFLLLWAASKTSVRGYQSSTDVLNRDDFPEGTVDDDDLLDVAEYEDGIYEVAAAQNPENGDIIVVSTETGNDELLIAEIDPDDPGAGAEFTAAEDASIVFQPNIACTAEGCFVAFRGIYQETDGLHLVSLGELVSVSD